MSTPEVQRVTSTTGEPVWLVSGHAAVKALLADARLSRTHPDPRHPARMTQVGVFGGPIGDPEAEAADHARLRRLLTRPFSARRMDVLRPSVEALATGLLNDLEAAGAPADFHARVAYPVPLLVICERLGVPEAERADFRRWASEATQMQHPARSRAGLQSLWRYLGALVERKRWEPGVDVITDLVEAKASDPQLTDDGIANLAAGILLAGHATAVSIIDRGILLLATHPAARSALAADPALVPAAIEEIIRVPSPLDPPAATRRGGLPRYAAADIAIAGVTIRRGDLVMFALQEANQDPHVFAEPDRFDVGRTENPHLAFSYGLHFCIGAPLARMELQVLFAQLFTRFPDLRPARGLGELKALPDRVSGAVAELPVTW
jgi:cytochrome P450